MELFRKFKRMLNRAKPQFGVAIDAGEIRAARVSNNGHGLLVAGTARVRGPETDTGGAIDQAALTSALREVAAATGYEGESVVGALPGMAVIERLIKVPVMPSGELEAAVRWEAEQHIPVPLDDMILRHVVLGEEQNHERKLRIMVAACRRDAVVSFQRAFTAAGLTLAAIDLPALALWRYFCGDEGKESARRLAIVNVDSVVTQCLFTEGERLLFSRTSPVGSRSIGLNPPGSEKPDGPVDYGAVNTLDRFPGGWGEVAAAGEPLQPTGGITDGVSAEEVFTGSFPSGSGSNGGVLVGQLAGEIKRSLDFFRSTHGDWVPEKVVLSGSAARWPDLAGILANELEMGVSVPGGFEPAEGDNAAFDPSLVTACGLAMWGVKQ